MQWTVQFSLSLFLIVIAYYSNVIAGEAEPINDIKCYRCNNGYVASPKCVNAPNEDKRIKVVKSQGDNADCMSVTEFFAKYNMVTNEWSKRTLRGKAKGRSTFTEDVIAYCATVIVHTKDEAVPQVYRDCVQGTPEEVSRNFRNTFEFDMGSDDNGFNMPEGNSTKNECSNKKVESERGTRVVNVCLCQGNFCNRDKAKAMGGCAGLRLHFLSYWFLFAMALTCIERYSGVS